MTLHETIEAVATEPGLILPTGEIFIGGDITDFVRNGVDIAHALVRDAGLHAGSRVLEIGSGQGRPAIPLTRALTTGSYDGIDIVLDAVDWCKANITTRHPNFRFHHYDIHNEFYNPTGKGTVATTPLPFADDTFDIVFLSSVMTHLNTEDVLAYLPEIRRVLKPGGRLWATWFVVDAGMDDAVLDGRSKVPLGWTDGSGAYYTDANRNTLAVAFREPLIRAMHAMNKLRITYLQRGEWCERAKIDGGFQDVIVAEKTE
jgi:SAM-dependent methyltransferase